MNKKEHFQLNLIETEDTIKTLEILSKFILDLSEQQKELKKFYSLYLEIMELDNEKDIIFPYNLRWDMACSLSNFANSFPSPDMIQMILSQLINKINFTKLVKGDKNVKD